MESWRDWWTSVARFFGYDEWVWGSAADWFAAIGTVGALALGLVLFRGEQLRRDRVDADLFVTSASIVQSESSRDGVEYMLHVRVKNLGQNTVTRARVVVRNPTKRRQLSTGGDLRVEGRSPEDSLIDLQAIHRGESAWLEREVRRSTQPNDCYVIFDDWRGRRWIRSLDERAKYRSKRHLRRTFMPLSQQVDPSVQTARARRWRYDQH